MQVYCFHLMPWAYLPEDFSEKHNSAWVTAPNSLYDLELGSIRLTRASAFTRRTI